MKTAYTAFSKHNYYLKKIISAYVLKQGLMPLNPFMNWGYFLDDLVERDLVRKANTQLIDMSDELWQFGEVSNGCYHELLLAMEREKPIKFFTVGGETKTIRPITNVDELVFEDELAAETNIQDFKQKCAQYLERIG